MIMNPTREEILAYLLETVEKLCQDWDYADAVSADSLLFTGLGLESLEAVVLCTSIQDHYNHTVMPFAELLAEIGQKQRDLSIAELADFVYTHLNTAAGKAEPPVELTPRRVG
jgi:acyl carrier protein